MKKRDRGPTPKSTSLAFGVQSSIDKMFGDCTSGAVPESTEVKPDTASAFCLKGEGTSEDLKSKEDKSKDIARVIPDNENIKKHLKERKKRIRNNYRVPVLNPDGTLAMPTTSKRANKWLKEKKAKIVKNKLGIFQVQLLKELDPGSAFTGIGVISKKAILYGVTLELSGYKNGSKPNIIVNRFGKKIEKYQNTIVEGMDKRRQLRRGRRHRKTRRRPARWLNRSKSKIPPSILARKQLELKMATELSNIYPISMIGLEDVKFNHYKCIKGQFFSHVEVGKNWILNELQKLVNSPIRLIKGYETNIRRQQLKLPKEEDKTKRSLKSHVTDCIAMGSIILGKIRFNKFKFDTITRPKYSRRFLHLEQFEKGGFRRKYGGSTVYPLNWTNIRKGDYVEAIQGKKIYRGWVSGFIDDKRIISVSNFDWKRIGQFGESNVRLIGRNNGLLIERLYMEKDRIDVCKFGTVQVGIDNAW